MYCPIASGRINAQRIRVSVERRAVSMVWTRSIANVISRSALVPITLLSTRLDRVLNLKNGNYCCEISEEMPFTAVLEINAANRIRNIVFESGTSDGR